MEELLKNYNVQYQKQMDLANTWQQRRRHDNQVLCSKGSSLELHIITLLLFACFIFYRPEFEPLNV